MSVIDNLEPLATSVSLVNFFQRIMFPGPPSAVQVNVAFPPSAPKMAAGVAVTLPSGETVNIYYETYL